MQNSTSTSGRRLAAALFLGVASAAMVAGPAHSGVTKASVDSDFKDPGLAEMSSDAGPNGKVKTALIGLLPDGGGKELLTYCIQATVNLDTTQVYDEMDWSSQGVATHIDARHLQAIKWILNNSFPALTSAQLAANAKIKGGVTDVEAVAGTQAAIWSFSDAAGHTQLDTATQDGDDPAVTLIYSYLVSAAKTHMDDPGQPQTSLDLIPLQSGKAKPGDKVGYKVTSSDTTDAFKVDLAGNPSGAKLVGADGKPLPANATFKNGDTVYVQLPSAPSQGTVTLTASGTVSDIEAGRVFVKEPSVTAPGPSQNLILAQSQNAPVSATTSIAWKAVVSPPSSPSSTPSTSSHSSTTPSTTPSTATSTATPSSAPSTPTATATTTPPGGLARTGADNTMAIGGGALALVAAGGGMVVYTRRKKAGEGTHS